MSKQEFDLPENVLRATEIIRERGELTLDEFLELAEPQLKRRLYKLHLAERILRDFFENFRPRKENQYQDHLLFIIPFEEVHYDEHSGLDAYIFYEDGKGFVFGRSLSLIDLVRLMFVMAIKEDYLFEKFREDRSHIPLEELKEVKERLLQLKSHEVADEELEQLPQILKQNLTEAANANLLGAEETARIGRFFWDSGVKEARRQAYMGGFEIDEKTVEQIREIYEANKVD